MVGSVARKVGGREEISQLLQETRILTLAAVGSILESQTDSAATSREKRQKRKQRIRLSRRQSRKLSRLGMVNPRVVQQAGIGEGLHKLATKQFNCGKYLVMREALEGPDREPRVHNAFYCNQHQTCPFCAGRRAEKLCEKYAPRIMHVMQQGQAREAHFFTFTQPHEVEDYLASYQRLSASLEKLRHRVRNAHNRGGELASIVGMVGQFEQHKGKDGNPHTHFHAVIVTEGPVDYGLVADNWKTITGGIQPDMRPLSTQRKAWKRRDEGNPMTAEEFATGLRRDLVEVLKYPAKFEDMPASEIWERRADFYGNRPRLVRTWFEMRAVEVPEEDLEATPDTDIDWESVEYEEFYWVWCDKTENYEDICRHRVPLELLDARAPVKYSEFYEFSGQETG
jgi:hypothetical protein